ncbi:hypothetical protein JGH11_13155 [Dysgonomonas sp. Marseille-P4677]|nr:hypothetical protein [Dysgonomonas sp. Marseille-P4677]MBK5721821.1 hypothetical protein [Dysgonomonas sp. Marseille-P4677]
MITEDSDSDLGTLFLLKDSKVNLYTGLPKTTKKKTIRYKEEFVKSLSA